MKVCCVVLCCVVLCCAVSGEKRREIRFERLKTDSSGCSAPVKRVIGGRVAFGERFRTLSRLIRLIRQRAADGCRCAPLKTAGQAIGRH